MKPRREALALLHEYTESESLRRHAYAVEAAMRAYADFFHEDVDRFGITGLIHDFDYEKYPSEEEHTVVGCNILRDRDYPEDIIDAIWAHAHTEGMENQTLLARTLFAVDELSGFLMAVAMVRPGRRLSEVEVKSVKKKLKDKAFARGVHRDDVYRGAQVLGRELDDHIQLVLDALKAIAPELGLDGDS